MLNTRLKEVEIDGVKQWITVVDISELKEWSKNSELRIIGPEGYRRVKEQIKELGVYKPLIVTADGEILGGAGSRIKAYREDGITEVWVSVVPAKDDESKKFKYNISDNDSPGFYNTEGVANNIDQFNLNQENYSIQIDEPIVLSDLANIETNNPGDDSGGNKDPKLLVCPECGHEGGSKDFAS